MGDPRDFYPQGLEQFGKIQSSGFSLNIRIGRDNDLCHKGSVEDGQAALESGYLPAQSHQAAIESPSTHGIRRNISECA